MFGSVEGLELGCSGFGLACSCSGISLGDVGFRVYRWKVLSSGLQSVHGTVLAWEG